MGSQAGSRGPSFRKGPGVSGPQNTRLRAFLEHPKRGGKHWVKDRVSACSKCFSVGSRGEYCMYTCTYVMSVYYIRHLDSQWDA